MLLLLLSFCLICVIVSNIDFSFSIGQDALFVVRGIGAISQKFTKRFGPFSLWNV